MIIRKMTLCEYITAYENYTPAPLCDTHFEFDEEKIKRQYSFLKNTFGIFLETEIIGFVTLKPQGENTCEFGITLLNDSFKNKGYGKTATEKTLSLLKDAKIKKVIAKTDTKNTPMQKILHSLGFEKVKTEKTVVAPSCEIREFLVFEKEL